MKIVLTGSVGNIGEPLVKKLVKNRHTVTVISSNPERIPAIEALGAEAAIGNMFDRDFLKSTFENAEIVYLMETLEAVGSFFDKEKDFIGSIEKIGQNYFEAIKAAGIQKVIHLSSIGAHLEKENGILQFHYIVENILNKLPDTVSIKFMRPVGFYTNMYSLINTIKKTGSIISNYGGNKKEPWVSPLDIADVIAEEINKPFTGRTIRYIASDQVSPNEIADVLGKAIDQKDLKWIAIPDDQLLSNWLEIGFNEQIASVFVEMQNSQGTGLLYEDYYKNKPILGKVKLTDFAEDFARLYCSES